MVKSKFIVVNKKVTGLPTKDDFSIKEEELPRCEDGDLIMEGVYHSVDPYMRYRLAQMQAGEIVPGQRLAKVIESKNAEYPVGCYIVAFEGWRTTSHVPKDKLGNEGLLPVYMKLPEMGPLPISLSLGVLGMVGNTAYFGFLEICKPKEGETVLVNGAAGAVGSLVCQIAKIKGCKVIGFAGSDKKVEWIKELGVDCAFNYKTCGDLSEVIKKCAPDGVDCYFDNVGGEFSINVIPQMATFGRISICGAISGYNDTDAERTKRSSPYNEPTILWKQLSVQGFIVTRWNSRWMEGINQMAQWIMQGKLKYKEHITEGFEKMPEAFLGLFKGENFGKSIVKA